MARAAKGGHPRGMISLEMLILIPLWILFLGIITQMCLIYWMDGAVKHAAYRAVRTLAVEQIPAERDEEGPNWLAEGGGKLRVAQLAAAWQLRKTAGVLGEIYDSYFWVRIEAVSGADKTYEESEVVEIRLEYDAPCIVPVVNVLCGTKSGSGVLATLGAAVMGRRSVTLVATARMHNEGLRRRPGGP